MSDKTFAVMLVIVVLIVTSAFTYNLHKGREAYLECLASQERMAEKHPDNRNYSSCYR